MKIDIKYHFLIWGVLFTFFCCSVAYGQEKDSLKSELLPFPIKSQNLDNYFFMGKSSLFLSLPENIQNVFIYDAESNTYILTQKIGKINYRFPTVLNFESYQKFITEKNKFEFWKKQQQTSSGATQAGLIPSIYIGKDIFENVFGSNFIDIRPQGSAELSFGILSNHRKDETLDVRRRKTTSFDFNEKIQVNVLAQIGEKIKFRTNYNTESIFEFENNLSLKYEGDEDEILQLIEAGDINFSIPSTLIRGSQGLFGVKTKLKFGNTFVTSVFSQQESEISTIDVQGGAQTNEFYLSALDYEENRHFFIGQYFREDIIGDDGKQSNRFNKALETLPIVTSNINITKIEVWVTNIGAAITENRNIIAFLDLGESNPYEQALNSNFHLPSNNSNDLLSRLDESKVRDINTVTQYLRSDPLNIGSTGYLVAGEDFEKIESARKLNSNEYTFNSRLGFISLNITLNPDQVLAVAYQYTILGDNTVYQVGEFSDQGINSPNNLIVKLLKSTSINTKNPKWDLMMKNVYSMQAYQVNSEDFVLNILYYGDEKGIPTAYFNEGDDEVRGVPIIQLMGLDNLDQQLNPPSDGVFDFIDNAAINGGTIQSTNGRIFFPLLEPFGKDLRNIFDNSEIADKYAFDSLYTMIKSDAEQYPEKNKYILEGFFKSSASNEISLNAFNVPQGSVKVTAGGIPLLENIDYIVDYTLGRVRIINEGILNSGTPLKISLENNSMFNMQTKRYMGVHVDHKINEKANISASIINLNERPLTPKTNYGDDPISNTIWGFNFNYGDESLLLTKLIDKIPFINTNAKSRINIEGEFAHFIPGHSAFVGETGISYIDDFEGTKSTIDLKYFNTWVLASTPQEQYNLFPEAAPNEGLNYGKNRARLAWYIIDPLFYEKNSQYKPPNITAEELSKHSVRQVLENEIFPNKDIPSGISTNISVLNLVFYPNEKGPYNYDVNPVNNLTAGIDSEGDLLVPESRWGGIMRKIETTNFEAANIEYIEFWMMDPFTDDPLNTGKIYFNLGDISEDILRDSRKSFENGLPINENVIDVDTTIWGRVPVIQSLVESFDNNKGSRLYQDVGYDGLSSIDERSFFSEGGVHSYINEIETKYGINSGAYVKATTDPASDDYHYFRGTDFDTDDQYASILERYKLFNNPEGNSPTDDINFENYSTSATSFPNIEDINRDNTLSEAERYFQYEIDLDPDKMIVGQNHIADIFEASTHQLPNGEIKHVKWYQFKIPVNSPDDVFGNIKDFKSIRFLRIFMREFKSPITLRFATFDLVRSEWRRYRKSLLRPGEFIDDTGQDETLFDITAVNIEENGGKVPIPYVIPPGIEREMNYTTTNLVRRNEQSMVLRIQNLLDGDVRGAFKTADFDLRQYKYLKMYVHAEKLNEQDVIENDDLTVFIRLGSDFNENYYEYEIPLKLTPWGTTFSEPDVIWPEENNFNIELEELANIKLSRNEAMKEANSGVSIQSPYTVQKGDHKITVLGTPSLSDVKVLLMGIRNPKKRVFIDDDDGLPKNVEIWINELRLSDYRSKGGWAATARLSAVLADLGRIVLSGSYSTPGFGSVEQKVNETQKDKITNFAISTNIEFGKFFPENTGLKIPVYFDYSQSKISPEFNPLNPDIKLEKELKYYETKKEKDSLKSLVEDYIHQKNINFTNVRKEPRGGKKSRFYDIENFNFNYAYSEIYARNVDVLFDLRRIYRGGFAYNYRASPKPIKPFNKIGFLSKSPYFALIKDFNFYLTPQIISVSSDMYRVHNKRKYRNKSIGEIPMETFYMKKWDWNRDYNINHSITQSLNFNFQSRANAYINEPAVEPEKENPDYRSHKKIIWNEIRNFGTLRRYDQSLTINYDLPINKIPILNWITSNFKYMGTFNWTASPESVQERFGNQIENSMQIQFNGNFNLTKLYGKLPFIEKLNKSRNQQNYPGRINSKPEQNEINDISENLIPNKSFSENNLGKEIQKFFLNIITGIKRTSFSYTEIASTFLPGFIPVPHILGNTRNYTPDKNIFVDYPYFDDDYPTTLAPGFGFVFGDQRDIRNDAIRNGWLSPDTLMNQSYYTKRTINFSSRISLEPLPELKIEITADRAYALNHQEFFRADANGEFFSFSPIDNGSFSMSFLAFKTAFRDDMSNNFSKAFENMKNSREIIALRLAEQNPNWSNSFIQYEIIDNVGNKVTVVYPEGYGPDAQDVMMYSFLSAYSGKDPKTIKLEMFPRIPLPNWHLTYSGLTKINFFKKFFRNITITHSYRASYNVGNFQSNIERVLINGYPSSYYTDSFNFIPEYDISQISIIEQFLPLISIDLVMKNNLSSKMEVKKSRNLSFSFANNQLTEMKSDEFVVGIGYRIRDVNLGFKVASGNNGRTKQVKSDLNVKADFSLRKNKTNLRRIDENINQISAGQEVLSINLSADYLISQKLNFRFYYDRVVNNPFVSSQYPNSITSSGISMRFFLN